jgi:hypothetical protein
MKGTLIAIGIVCWSMGAAAETAEKRARALYDEGMKFYNTGDFPVALESFKAAYFAKPDPIFLFNMGQCYRMMGDAEGSARQYRAYLRQRPDAPNHDDVERFIHDAEETMRRKAANEPPTGVLPPPEHPVAPTSVAPAQPPPPPTTSPPRRRWWIPVVAGGGAAVVVTALALGLAFGISHDAPVPTGTDPSASIRFP